MRLREQPAASPQEIPDPEPRAPLELAGPLHVAPHLDGVPHGAGERRGAQHVAVGHRFPEAVGRQVEQLAARAVDRALHLDAALVPQRRDAPGERQQVSHRGPGRALVARRAQHRALDRRRGAPQWDVHHVLGVEPPVPRAIACREERVQVQRGHGLPLSSHCDGAQRAARVRTARGEERVEHGRPAGHPVQPRRAHRARDEDRDRSETPQRHADRGVAIHAREGGLELGLHVAQRAAVHGDGRDLGEAHHALAVHHGLEPSRLLDLGPDHHLDQVAAPEHVVGAHGQIAGRGPFAAASEEVQAKERQRAGVGRPAGVLVFCGGAALGRRGRRRRG